jgi:hypothetical protein
VTSVRDSIVNSWIYSKVEDAQTFSWHLKHNNCDGVGSLVERMRYELLAPKATGCLLQGDDIPRICASLSAFGAQFGCGAGTALLGITFPHLILKFDFQVSHLGPKVFSSAAVGFIIGLAVSYHVRQTMTLNLSRVSLACLSIFLASFLQLLVMFSDDISLICLLYLLQFTAFGSVEGFTLVALFEMWGQRIQVSPSVSPHSSTPDRVSLLSSSRGSTPRLSPSPSDVSFFLFSSEIRNMMRSMFSQRSCASSLSLAYSVISSTLSFAIRTSRTTAQ